MKSQALFFGLAFAMAASAFGQVRYEGRVVSEVISRTGPSLDTSVKFSRTLQTEIDRIYDRKMWTRQALPTARCRTSGGTGDGDWRGAWNAVNAEDKAQRLASAIAGLTLEGARQIVRDGYMRSKPRSWADFSNEIRRADNQPDSIGYSKAVLGVYADMNRQNLGYNESIPRIGGDGDWRGYWDAGPRERPSRLAQAVRGLDYDEARLIVNSGVMSTLPRSWSDFTNRILDVERRTERGFSYDVLVTYGRENMRSLGYFDDSACDYDYTYQLVLTVQTVREPDHSASRALELNLSGALLLKDEKERFTFSFDGVDDRLDIESRYYKYDATRTIDSSGAVIYQLNAHRQMVTPPNTVETVLANQNSRLYVDLTDAGYLQDYAEEMGDLTVHVEVYRSQIFWDKKLAEFDVKIAPDGKPVHYDTGLNPPSGKIYVSYTIRRTNSAFYSNAQSAEKSSAKLQF